MESAAEERRGSVIVNAMPGNVNLSGVIGAMCTKEGVVFHFGEKLEYVRIRKNEGVRK